MTVLPYNSSKEEGKKQQVASMFNNISHKYDLLNHLLSAGIDITWRKKAIGMLKKEHPKLILDIATGTGDFAIEALSLKPEKVIGVDISEGMLKVGKDKITKAGLSSQIELMAGDSENLQFSSNNFDAVIVAFGVRNFEDLERGLQEMHRVLKKGGTVVILEFSKPEKFPVKNFYNFYFRFILPLVGKLVSKDKAAYTYLPESVQNFPYGKEFLKILEKTGFHSSQCIKLTFGISSIYIAKK
jgi:demethylmenaquinone methyltransferase / 2-methoxy-6-polyprenyl-1,4-benzoquinol methylase